MPCAVMKREQSKMREKTIFRAREARKLANCGPNLISDLILANVIKPAFAGTGKGSENLLDINDVHAAIVYIALRELNVEVEVAQDTARIAHGVDMRDALDSGECFLLITPDCVPNRTFSLAEARQEMCDLIAGGQDVSRVVSVNLVATWAVLLQRIEALIAADHAQKAGA